jgi:hypothetical protein
MLWDIYGDTYRIRFPRTPPAKVYLRYGLFRGMRKSRNYSTRHQEAGLSVYRAELRKGVVYLTDETGDSLPGQGRLCIPVTGKEVGIGSDGQPLLIHVKALGYAIDLAAKR